MSCKHANRLHSIPLGLVILVLACCVALPGCSSTHGPSEPQLPSDFWVTYHFSCGSITPLYWYSLDVSLDASSHVGEATIAGFDPVDPPSLTLGFEVNEASLVVVLEHMIENRIFRPFWESVTCPDGAGVRRLEVRAWGSHYRIPPEGSSGCLLDQESLDEVCDTIWLSVPASVRDSLMSARESWISGGE